MWSKKGGRGKTAQNVFETIGKQEKLVLSNIKTLSEIMPLSLCNVSHGIIKRSMEENRIPRNKPLWIWKEKCSLI